MGRQIHFYMLPEDRNEFLSFVQQGDSVLATLRDANTGQVNPSTDFDMHKTLSLWNCRLSPHPQRKWVPEPGYYRIDDSKTPTLEFVPSFTATWEGNPALGQGRLYGVFEGKPKAFEKWYEMLARWIRKHYKRSPTSMGGYVGPAAYEFYKTGGYLLPQFLPPRTEVWLAEIGKQHSPSDEPGQGSKILKGRSSR